MSCVRGLFSGKRHRHSTSSETILASVSSGTPGSNNGGSAVAPASTTPLVETESNSSDGNVGRNSRTKTRGSAGHQAASLDSPDSRSAALGTNGGSLSLAATSALQHGGASTSASSSTGAGSVSSRGISSTFFFSRGARAASVAYRTLRVGAFAEKSGIVGSSSGAPGGSKKHPCPASSAPPLVTATPTRPLKLPPVVAKSQSKRETSAIKSAGKENANPSDQRPQHSTPRLTIQATLPLTPALASIVGKGGKEVAPQARDLARPSGSEKTEAAEVEASPRHNGSPGPDLPGLPVKSSTITAASRSNSPCLVATSRAAEDGSGSSSSRPAAASTAVEVASDVAAFSEGGGADDVGSLLAAGSSSPPKQSGSSSSKTKFTSSKGSIPATGQEPLPSNTKLGDLKTGEAGFNVALSCRTAGNDCVEEKNSTLSLSKGHSASKSVLQGQKVYESVYCPSNAVLTIADLTNEILTNICYLAVDRQFYKDSVAYTRLTEDEEEEEENGLSVGNLQEEVKQRCDQKTAAECKSGAYWEDSQQLWKDVSVDDNLPLIDSRQGLQTQSSSEEESNSVLALLNQRFSQTGFSSHSQLCSVPEHISAQETLCSRHKDNSSINLNSVPITLKTHSQTDRAEIPDLCRDYGFQPQANRLDCLSSSEAAQSDVVSKTKGKASTVSSSSKLSPSTSGDDTEDGTDDVKQMNATDAGVERGGTRSTGQIRISPNKDCRLVGKNGDSPNSFCENMESDNDVVEDGDQKRIDSLEDFTMKKPEKCNTESLASGSQGGATHRPQETSASKHFNCSLDHGAFPDSIAATDNSLSFTQAGTASETVAERTESAGQWTRSEDLFASACMDSSPVLLPTLVPNAGLERLPAADDSRDNRSESEPGSCQVSRESTSAMESFSINVRTGNDRSNTAQEDTEDDEDEVLSQEPHSTSPPLVKPEEDREEGRTLDIMAVVQRNVEECARLHMCVIADGGEEIPLQGPDAQGCELMPSVDDHLGEQYPEDTATCTSLQGRSADAQSDMVNINQEDTKKVLNGKDLLSLGQKLVDQLCTNGNISGNRNDTPPVEVVPHNVQYNSQPAEGVSPAGESPQSAATVGPASTLQAETDENPQSPLSHPGGFCSESDRTLRAASMANGHDSQIEISSESEHLSFTSVSCHLLDLLNIEEGSDIARNSRRSKVLFEDDCPEEDLVTGQRKNDPDEMETSHLCARISYSPRHPVAELYLQAHAPLQQDRERQGLEVRRFRFMGESSTTSADNRKHAGGGSAGSQDNPQNPHTAERQQQRVLVFNDGSLAGEHDPGQELASRSARGSAEVEEEVLEDEEEEEAEELIVSGLMDVFQLDQQCSRNKCEVNSAMKKLSKKQRKATILQHYILQQMREKDELSRLMKLCESQSEALKEEKKSLNLELQNTCDLMTVDDEGSAKKHEPLMYKKYCAVKTSLDAKGLLTTIRNRQRALHFLEAMTYRRYVALQHSLKIEGEKAETDEKKKGGSKPSATPTNNPGDKVSTSSSNNVSPSHPSPPKKLRRVKDLASLCGTLPTQTPQPPTTPTPSARPTAATTALLPLRPILLPSPYHNSDGTTPSAGAVVLPGFLQGPVGVPGSGAGGGGGVSVFSWPPSSAGHLNFDEILETDV